MSSRGGARRSECESGGQWSKSAGGARSLAQTISHWRNPPSAVTCLPPSGAESSRERGTATAMPYRGPSLSPPPHRQATFVAASCTLHDPNSAQSARSRNIARCAPHAWFFIDARVAPRAPSSFVRRNDPCGKKRRAAEPPRPRRNSPPGSRRDRHHTSLLAPSALFPSGASPRLRTRTLLLPFRSAVVLPPQRLRGPGDACSPFPLIRQAPVCRSTTPQPLLGGGPRDVDDGTTRASSDEGQAARQGLRAAQQ